MKSLAFFFLFLLAACSRPEQQPSEGAAAPQTVAAEKTPVVENAPPTASDTLPGTGALTFSTDYLMGKFEPAKQPGFVSVEAKYSDGDPYFLRKEAYESFKKMWAAAKANGIDLKIISATRNFFRQKQIWEAKWTGARKLSDGTDAPKKYPAAKDRALKILEYSSMPGTSRHHWGTDIDINALENSYFEQGQGKKVYDWLTAHAHEFGFCQPYSPKGSERPHGYNEEKWHWSYLPVARQLTTLAAAELTDGMIAGFKGAEAAAEIGVVKKYVLGINEACF